MDTSHINNEIILTATQKFMGEIFQTPPIFSAIKINGKPAYLSARKGEDIVLEPRKILISSFDVVNTELPKVYFKVVCSTGTYIRSLANDFGKSLNVGAYLSSLCRTRIGQYKLEDAQLLEVFIKQIQALKENENIEMNV